MSAEFSNTYQEILLDNLVSIIKQNFVFQTQLKLAEKIGQEKAELQARFDDVNTKYEAIKGNVELLEQLRARADISSSVVEDKNRIQLALNDFMSKNNVLQKQLKDKELEISELKKTIEKLEEIAPISKLKKINVEKKKEPETVTTVLEEKKVDDGSSF